MPVPLGVYHGGFGMANLYKGGVLVGTETPDINSTAAGTNGQILISADAGAAPKFASLTSPDGSVTFIPGPNSLGLEATAGPSVATEYDTNSGNAVPALNVLNIVGGSGISTTGSGNTITINASATGFTWNVITAATATMATSNGYICNRNSGVLLSLPVLASVGDTFKVTNINNIGNWTIQQNASQYIQFGNVQTTVTTGSISSTQVGDSIEIICTILNTAFLVLNVQGNIQFV